MHSLSSVLPSGHVEVTKQSCGPLAAFLAAAAKAARATTLRQMAWRCVSSLHKLEGVVDGVRCMCGRPGPGCVHPARVAVRMAAWGALQGIHSLDIQ